MLAKARVLIGVVEKKHESLSLWENEGEQRQLKRRLDYQMSLINEYGQEQVMLSMPVFVGNESGPELLKRVTAFQL